MVKFDRILCVVMFTVVICCIYSYYVQLSEWFCHTKICMQIHILNDGNFGFAADFNGLLLNWCCLWLSIRIASAQSVSLRVSFQRYSTLLLPSTTVTKFLPIVVFL